MRDVVEYAAKESEARAVTLLRRFIKLHEECLCVRRKHPGYDAEDHKKTTRCGRCQGILLEYYDDGADTADGLYKCVKAFLDDEETG